MVACTIEEWRSAQHPSTATGRQPRLRDALPAEGGYNTALLTPIPRRVALYRSASFLGGGSTRGSSGGGRSRRTRAGGSVSYTASEWRSIEPLARKATEQAREHPERRDLFLCHAWDDREGSAYELYDRLKSNGATVWFSEKDVALGKQLLREIDKGLGNSTRRNRFGYPGAAQEHRDRGHCGEGTLGVARKRPGNPGRTRDDIRGPSGHQPHARLARRTGHRRVVAGGRGSQGRRRGRRARRGRRLTRHSSGAVGPSTEQTARSALVATLARCSPALHTLLLRPFQTSIFSRGGSGELGPWKPRRD